MQMIKAKVSEIFSSIQGEGRFAGVKQVFVRFFQCNMHCAWCDTPLSIGDAGGTFEELDSSQVFARISPLWSGCHSVSLTGGEPLLQKNFLRQLLPLMKKAQMPVYLETNGILSRELADIIHDVDMIAMDIKMPSSTKEKSYWDEHEEFLKVALQECGKDVFLKAVVSGDTDKTDIVRAVELVVRLKPDIAFILQPNTFDLNTALTSSKSLKASQGSTDYHIPFRKVSNGVIQKCLDFQEYCLKYLPNTRIMPQMHKFMRVR